MIITAIEQRKGTACALYVEGEFAMTLDAELVYGEGLRAGQEIGRQKLDELREKSELRRARERALYLLGFKSRTRKELYDALAREFGDEAAEQVTGRMEELGLVNDEDYARRFARQLVHNKGYGVARARQELLRKGIGRDLAQEALEELEETVDVDEKLAGIITRRYARYLGDEKGRRKTVNALIRLGYRYDDIRRVLLEQFSEECGD